MKALLVDDHPLVFQDLQAALVASGHMSLIVAGSVAAARSLLHRDDSFDLILLDLDSGGGDGMAFLAEVRAAKPGIQVIALSSASKGDSVGASLVDPLRLLSEISRRSPVDPDDAPGVTFEPDRDAEEWRFRTTAHASLLDLGLTRRQTEVLAFLLEGWSNKAIARELSLSVDTIKDHVTALMRALNVRSRTQAVLAVTRRMRALHQAHHAHRVRRAEPAFASSGPPR